MKNNEILEWSRSVINKIMEKENNIRYLYYIEIKLCPNPLNYDGMDSVDIKIMKLDQKTENSTLWFSTGFCFNIKEAIERVNKKLKTPTIKMIVAVSLNGVIGLDGKIPWNYPEDMKYFRKMTLDSTIIMGRKTYESIGKPLPKRRNIIITSSNIENENAECFSSLKDSINSVTFHSNDIWLIGGFSIYKEGMIYTDEIHLTLIPEIVEEKNAVYFPEIDFKFFKEKSFSYLDENKKIKNIVYERIK